MSRHLPANTTILTSRFRVTHTDHHLHRLGVGHAVPQDIADGTFTRRAPTTNDKLLEQLIGKKRAKAHLAAKQDAERASARQQPAWQQQQQQKNEAHKVEESDDDEESRAAVITSKRQKTQAEKKKRDAGSKDESGDEIDLKPKKRVRKGRAGPTSYLDELLASRSAKKKNKAAGAEDM